MGFKDSSKPKPFCDSVICFFNTGELGFLISKRQTARLYWEHMRLRQLLNMSGGFPELTLDLLKILLAHSQTLKRENIIALSK